MTHPLISELSSLDLPLSDWAFFGSGPLLMRGWIEDVGDLDVVSRGRAWRHARRLGRASVLHTGAEIVAIGERMTVGTTWAYGDVDVHRLTDTAEMIDGVPCVTIHHVVAYKRIADRPKDRAHLAIIEEHS